MPGPKIIISADGFEIVSGNRASDKVLFDDVTRIVAYKLDELTTDLIYCDITTGCGSNARVRTLHEEVPGFEHLLESFKSSPGFYPNWREAVVLPAFAENRTVVFQRASHQA